MQPSQQLAKSYQAKAKAYAIAGYHPRAAPLLHQALKMSKLTANDHIIINAKIERLKKVKKNF